ncbi:hypothetical protein [Buttiauxella brennerae]|uniref:hypothetical protein n=1 Tax=Buttiauxella brennerae TaxID=82988 RepID=UPI00286F565B|nr:hypothetical protein [Buttiauxella brennerae]
MTTLNDNRQAEQAQQGVLAVQPINLLPGAMTNTDHPIFAISQEYTTRGTEYIQQMRQLTPPSEANIEKNMWISSFMIGLSAALASGNAAGGITAGLWAAIAIHDGGYALRQRGEHVDSLLKQGYTFPAVLKWYEDGDEKVLEQEYKQMQENTRFTLREQQQDRQFNDRMDMEDKRMNQRDQQFNARMNMEGARFGEMVRHNMASEQAAIAASQRAGESADRAERRLDISERRQLHSEFNDTIKGAKQKQYYMRMAEKSVEQLKGYVASGDKAGAAEAYHNVRNNLARASIGGNASLTPEQIQESTGLPSLMDEKANEMGLAVNGLPTQMFIRTTEKQISDDILNEQNTIKEQAKSFFDTMIADGYSTEEAARYVNHGMMGTAIGNLDLDGNASKAAGGESTAGKAAPAVGDVVKGYRFKGGDPSQSDSWEKV